MLQGKIRGIWEEAITGISSLLNRIKSLLSNTLSAPRHLKAQVREVEGSNDPPSGSLQGACLGCSTEAVRLPLKTETTSSFHREAATGQTVFAKTSAERKLHFSRI